MVDLPPPAHADDDAFSSIAPFYDLDFEDYHDDFSFYRQLAENHGRSVLELGCGTGRVAVPLAEAGLQVVGVDVNEAMLAVGRARASAAKVRVEWLHGDMTTLALGRRFNLVTVPLGGVQHLPGSDALVEALIVMARHLDRGGVAVVDIEAPHSDDWQVGPLPIVEHWTKPWRGGTVTKVVAVEPHPADGMKQITWHFDVAAADGALRRVTAQFDFRTITPDEVHLAARLAGLRVIARFGDYEFTPYADGAERLIVLLQRHDDDMQWIYEEAAAYDTAGDGDDEGGVA